MKKITLLLAFIPFLALAQLSSEKKIKGNKIVELKTHKVEEFTSIEINNFFEVTLVIKSSPTVTVDADSNLHEHISIDVVEGKLTISTTKVFTRYKRLFIEIGANEKLSSIRVKGKSELIVKNVLTPEKLEVETYESAKIEMRYNAENASFFAKDKSELKINGTGGILNINLQDNAEIKADISCENFSALQHIKSKLKIKGKAAQSILQMSDDSYLDGADFVSKTMMLATSGDSESFINVADKLTLQASGKTTTNLLGEPIIELKTFKEEATLHKTNKAPSTLKKLLK